jgi:hypothetical protein
LGSEEIDEGMKRGLGEKTKNKNKKNKKKKDLRKKKLNLC